MTAPNFLHVEEWHFSPFVKLVMRRFCWIVRSEAPSCFLLLSLFLNDDEPVTKHLEQVLLAGERKGAKGLLEACWSILLDEENLLDGDDCDKFFVIIDFVMA
jgi:hypothetical protein